LGLHAVFPMKEALDCLLWLIQIVDDRFSIIESACGEYIDIVVLTHVGQKLEAVGSDIEPKLITFVSISNIGFLIFVENGVNQGFVQIHH